MMRLKNLLLQYRAVILYLIFGGCTTLVNIVCYFLCYQILWISNLASTAIAWFVSVLFAFVTNRSYVFGSQAREYRERLRELFSFFACRGMTGVMDMVIMYITVDCMNMNSLLWKIVSNILVIIINYIVSKLVIFKK